MGGMSVDYAGKKDSNNHGRGIIILKRNVKAKIVQRFL